MDVLPTIEQVASIRYNLNVINPLTTYFIKRCCSSNLYYSHTSYCLDNHHIKIRDIPIITSFD
jgi:hypothetical protein